MNAMATHSSTLAWKIPWTKESGRLQSIGLQRVRHDWATSLSHFTFMHWRRKWQPTPGSCLENPRDGGAWWAAVYGVVQSQTRLKWLSSSSSIECVQLQDVNHLIMEVQTNGDMSLLCNRNSGGRRLLALVQCSAVWKLISLPLTLPFLQNLRFSTAVSALSPCWKQEEGRIYLSSYLCLIGLIKHK